MSRNVGLDERQGIGVTKAAVYHPFMTEEEIALATAELASLEAVREVAEASHRHSRPGAVLVTSCTTGGVDREVVRQ